MQLIITGRQLNVRESLKELANKKLAKYDRFFGEDTVAYVTFSCKSNLQYAEITINAKGTFFRSEAGADTFQTAIDYAMDNLERQIRKQKTRVERRIRRNPVLEIPDLASAVEEEEEKYEIRVKTYPIRPMSQEDAILQMLLLDHQFFVFVDADTERTCVVYRRKAGGYGLIQPE